MKIYICCHKPCSVPVSNILQPIQVGKANSKFDLNMVSDNTGDNISDKNKYFCELTATYWIWKNTKDDIVGLYHYRRYLNLKSDHTRKNKIKPNFPQWSGNTPERIRFLLKTYDILLPPKGGSRKHPKSLYNLYKEVHIISDLDAMLDVIKEKYPHQYKTAYTVQHNETRGYYTNMLIAKRAVFNDYAKWMFDILFAVEKRIQPTLKNRDDYQQRVYGFLSERLITVYIALHPELKVGEFPTVFIDDDKKAWRKYIIRYWKRKILQKLGFRKGGKS